MVIIINIIFHHNHRVMPATTPNLNTTIHINNFDIFLFRTPYLGFAGMS